MDSLFCYNFPAIRGIQANKEYYVAMCPLRIIPKLFLFDEEEVPPEFRSQRILNKARIPEMTNYILSNPTDYVFSAITASVDGELMFTAYEGIVPNQNLGTLSISMEARFLINDGQHRRAAIEEALKMNSELANETISVVFYHDEGLSRSQQIFSDLNLHAINTTSSIGILYDHRDPLSLITKEIVESTPLLSSYTDKERVSLSKYSPKIFSLNHIYNSNRKILSKKKGEKIELEEQMFLKEFWLTICDTMIEWKLVASKEMNACKLRETYIIGHGVFIEAMGIVGKYLSEQHPTNWRNYIDRLSTVNWSRENRSDWLERAFNERGRIQKNTATIQLTANKIKQLIGLPLTVAEQQLEDTKK